MSTKLDLDHLKEIRKAVTKAINTVRTETLNAYSRKKISREQLVEAKDKWDELETKEIELQGSINSEELEMILDTSVENPVSRILQATHELEKAAQQNNNFSQLLSKISDVTQTIANIIKIIPTDQLLIL